MTLRNRLLLLLVAVLTGQAEALAERIKLLNASYDPTRELYQEINSTFVAEWKKGHSSHIDVLQSHGGSGKQARSVLEGLEADVVTLALAYDIDQIAKRGGLIALNWQSRLPNNSSPYFSTIVFLVRKGNPKGIKDWEDLVKPGISVITPNPKTSGGARWNYIAAWGYAERKLGLSESQAEGFMKKLFANVPVLDTGARGSTTTFVQREIGDVLLAWESEALLAKEELQAGAYEIVTPSMSIMAEPPVAVVDKVVDKKGTRLAAESYLRYLYGETAQESAARHHFRPRSESLTVKYAEKFPLIEMLEIDRDFGGWDKVQAKHFADGGVFDRIYAPSS
ncbi:MAG: sulfate ABC transporter substrate-binding protein [Deltaproteobacteria bacterium]|nr:sulfate ABC transporter substrate-binding protein [Deltaproteobacteria bacterium]